MLLERRFSDIIDVAGERTRIRWTEGDGKEEIPMGEEVGWEPVGLYRSQKGGRVIGLWISSTCQRSRIRFPTNMPSP